MANSQTSPAHRPAVTSKGGATAARILDVAVDQFSRLGFERVTMAGIAEAAGVSQPALHYHYEDKERLWQSAMLSVRTAVEGEELVFLALHDAPAILQLQSSMRLFLHVSWGNPALGRIVALEGMAAGDRLDWLVDQFLGPRLKRMADVVERAIAEGDLKPYPSEQIVVTLQAGAAGVINLSPLIRGAFDVDAGAPEGRAAHEAMVLDAVLGGFLTSQGRARLGRTE